MEAKSDRLQPMTFVFRYRTMLPTGLAMLFDEKAAAMPIEIEPAIVEIGLPYVYVNNKREVGTLIGIVPLVSMLQEDSLF